MSAQNWLRLVILSVVWGGSFFFVEVALQDVPPFTIVFLRVSLAALALLLVIKMRGGRIPFTLSLWGSFLVMGLLNNVIPFCLIVWGQTYITGSVASILNATTPIFTLLVAHLFTSDERLTFNKLLGVLVGFVGVFVMMQPTLKEGLSWSSYSQLAVLGAAISYAFAGIWGKRLKQESPLVNAAGMLTCSSIILLPIVFTVEAPLSVTPQIDSMASIIAIALLSTAVAYMLYFKILAGAGATNLLLVTFLIPASAILLGLSMLDETVETMALSGMAIIFAGLLLIDGRVLNAVQQKELRHAN
ncbi:MAG: EamA family transporter [Candidatus Latescibacteria bacterium]|nr:EamA family transporter [Candidatus Latescibacterota bacterium]